MIVDTMLRDLDKDKKESLFHTALLYLKRFNASSPRDDAKLRNLLEQHGTFEEIFNPSGGSLFPAEDSLAEIKGLEKVITKLEKLPFDFRTLAFGNKEFPSHLADVERAAPVLYVRGDIELFNYDSFAVVGTRNLIDSADIRAEKKLVEALVEKNYVIVSGLASGCDTLAHKHAIDCGGKTIAVLGTPLDFYYPPENKDLQEKIASEHLLVSQYPIGTKVYPSFFAHRNRTTVGLSSEGVAVVRAGDRSGTLHAVKNCLDQQKTLYVLENNLGKGYEWIEKYKGLFKVPNKTQKESEK